MIRTSHPVLRALDRWETKGLLTPDTTRRLKEEMEEELRGESRRWAQYLLAATGGAILVIAGSTFLAWVWPGMGAGGRSLTVGVIGFGVLGLGLRLPASRRWGPAAFLLQLCGPALIFFAMMYSREAWPDGTAQGLAVGSVGLVLPPILVFLGLKKHAALGALQLALGFLLLYGFFARGLSLPEESFLWILDGLLLVGLAFLATRLQSPEVPDWGMPMFASLCLTAFVLLSISGEVIWHLDAYTVVPMDLWLIIVAGLAYWGQQDTAPPHLRRDWFEYVLALCVLTGILFGFITTLEAFSTPPEVAALTVAGVGGLGLLYSLPRGSRVVLLAACIALLAAAWYYGAEKGGALGSVLALTLWAAVLFWGSSRLGKGEASPSSTQPE